MSQAVRKLTSVLWLKAALNFFMNRISIVLGSHPLLVVQISQSFGDRLRLHQKGCNRNQSLKRRLTGTNWRGRRFGTILVKPVFVKASIHTLLRHSNAKNSLAICVSLVERYQKHISCENNAVCRIRLRHTGSVNIQRDLSWSSVIFVKEYSFLLDVILRRVVNKQWRWERAWWPWKWRHHTPPKLRYNYLPVCRVWYPRNLNLQWKLYWGKHEILSGEFDVVSHQSTMTPKLGAAQFKLQIYSKTIWHLDVTNVAWNLLRSNYDLLTLNWKDFWSDEYMV